MHESVSGQDESLERFVSDLTGVMDAVCRRTASHAVIKDLLNIVVAHCKGIGACVCVVDADGLRVSVATESLQWFEGKSPPFKGSVIARLFSGQQISLEVDESDLIIPSNDQTGLADQINKEFLAIGKMPQRAILARTMVKNQILGAIGIFFSDKNSKENTLAHQLIKFAATAVEATSVCLPDSVNTQVKTIGSQPSIRDAVAVIDDQDEIQVWNPAAEQLTGLAHADALATRFPFPIPLPGKILIHHNPDGRYLEICCTSFQKGQRLLSFQDVTQARDARDEHELFLALAGHELRTSVTVIKGYAQTLALRWEQLANNWRRSAVETILARSDQLISLIDRVLVDSHIGFGATQESFELVAVTREAVQSLSAITSHHSLVVSLPSRLPLVLGNPSSLPIMLRELVNNAAKYSPEGTEIRITVGTDSNSAYLQVIDSGIGIKPDDVELVFNPFFQANQGSERKSSGLGLGLYVIRRLLDRQGGWVMLHPRTKQGQQGTIAEAHFPFAPLV